MKMTISKIIGGFMLTASMAFALTNCQKDQNTSYENNPNDSQSVTSEERNQSFGCEAAIPDILKVPEGNKLAYRVYATGVQIYEARYNPGNPYPFVWVNIAPSANLYTQPNFNNQVGTHYAGPTWEFEKGPYKDEKAVATKLYAATVDATAVPWLLLKTIEDHSSPGNKVTYIQRVCTSGGLAPVRIPTAEDLGQMEEVPYTATYLFYEEAN